MAEDSDTVADLLATLQLETGERPGPDSTIKPPTMRLDSLGRTSLADFRETQAGRADLVQITGDTLGEGGMGVVRLATQISLGRNVALKTLQAELVDEQNALQLLREGWVTARLEHPNVVPVHDAGVDHEGVPFLLLKRIEGETWTDLMHDPTGIASRFETADPLAWNVRTLQAVCNAVRAAHEARVIHRDIKPDNVMLGPVGEVYLLDWGIAEMLDDASKERAIAGTPAYMAPEMLRGIADPRTDVYLLGATLYDILAGRAPHRGGDLEDVLARVEASNPPRPEGPTELVDLCMRSLRRDPAERPQTATEFGRSLQSFLEHRLGWLLAEQAREQADLMKGASPGERRDLFAEAQFAYRQALRQWPDESLAREAARLVEEMVDFELDEGAVERARHLFDQLSAPTAGLTERMLASESEREAERLRGAEAVRDADPAIGQRQRMAMAFVIAVSLTFLPIVMARMLGRTPSTLTYLENHIATTFFLVMVLAAGVLFRESVRSNALNRRAFLALLWVPVGEVTLSFAGQQVDITLVQTLQLQFLWLAGCAAYSAAAVDLRLLVVGAVYLVGFIGSHLAPESLFWWLSSGNLSFALTVLWMWRR